MPFWRQVVCFAEVACGSGSSSLTIIRYACPWSSSSKFLGCCTSEGDPCSSTSCAAGNLEPAAYNGSYHGLFPDATCGFGSAFYTCGLDPSGKNTFWGCCKSNPCGNTPPSCPEGNLAGAFMDSPGQVDFYINSQLATTSTSAASSATSSPTSSSDSDEGNSSNGAVIGGAVGGAVAVLLIVGLVVFFLWRRRRNAKTARGDNVEVASPMMSDPKAFDPHSPNMAAQSRKHPSRLFTRRQLTEPKAPPTYSATNGDYYQSMAPQGKINPYTQSPYAQGQWAHNADGPQEMEADVGPSNRYSELPAEIERPTTHHRYSELSTGPSCRVSPHHSPKASQGENEPMPPMPQGLGVVTEDAPTKKLSLSRD